MAKRELKPLEFAINKTEKAGFKEALAVQLEMAYRILEQLKVFEQI